MKKIQKDLQSRSFKLSCHINNSFLPKFTPTANFDLYLNFGNADFGLHGVYHVTFISHNLFTGGAFIRGEVSIGDNMVYKYFRD